MPRRYLRAKRKPATKTSKALTMRKSKRPQVGLIPHRFVRMQANPWSISGNAAYTPYVYGQTFSMDQLVNNSEFGNLFDNYKITHAQVKFYLEIDPSAQSAAAAYYPKLLYVIDHDDANAPASLNEMREHARCQVRVMTPQKPVVINIKPSALSEMYRSPITTSYVPKWHQWIDCAHLNVPHYGLKFAIDNFTNPVYTARQEVKLWFSCKDTR